MFKPCPNCGFLVALIPGREASQRCPRCRSGLFDGEAPAAETPPATPRRPADGAGASGDAPTVVLASLRHHDVDEAPQSPGTTDASGIPPSTPAPVHEGAAPPAREDTPMPAVPGRTVADPAQPADPDVADTASGHGAVPADPAPPIPSFTRARRHAARPAGPRWPWIAGLPLLVLLLALQLLLAQRAELSQSPRWRPVVAAACGMLGCTVPPWREPAAIAMTARSVQPSAALPGTLHVTATLRNDARWPQPLPSLVLSLSDVDGRVVGARALAPRDYAAQPDALLAPGDSIDVAFDVREPSPRVVAFDFRLH